MKHWARCDLDSRTPGEAEQPSGSAAITAMAGYQCVGTEGLMAGQRNPLRGTAWHGTRALVRVRAAGRGIG
jgi:hypothetical protein